MRYLAWTLGTVLALAILIIGAAIAIQGPVTVGRMLAHGDTTIDDYAIYPYRALEPAPQPVALTEAPRPDLGRIPAGDGDLATFLAASKTIEFVVVMGGDVIFERYFAGRGAGDMSQVFSVSKSVLSILTGTAVADGLIASADQKVTDFVPELDRGGFDGVTVSDLLQMRSNMEYVENDNPFGQHVRFNFTPELKKEILTLTVRAKPDGRFIYKSGDNALLGLVLERALGGKSITQYTQERLWNPLGMVHQGRWSLDREGGFERTWCCLAATARDLAKLGMLYRDGGKWRGRQVVPADWVAASTRPAFTDEEWQRSGIAPQFWNYGYQWWLVDKARGDFSAVGKAGQYIYVDPANGVVIVRLGYRSGDPHGDWMQLFQAISDAAAHPERS